MNDPDYLKTHQYRDPRHLNARSTLHRRFTTNGYGLWNWVFDAMLERLDANADVLEVGCGPADLWRTNADRIPPGWNVTLTDFSPGMVRAAREALGAVHRDIVFLDADVQHLPFAAHTFDAVLANYMLYHVPDRPRAISEIARVLRPGGWLIAATNGERNLRELKDLIEQFTTAGKQTDDDSGFSLQNGSVQLSGHFDPVAGLTYDDELIITEVQPVLDYIGSLWPGLRPPDSIMEQVHDTVRNLITNGGGWHVQKETGMFVARLPE